MWRVVYLPEAERERSTLPDAEVAAMINADAKLRALGPTLGYPHSSAVRGEPGLRELRPRGGRSPWRAFYQRVGDTFVVAAVGPEAQVNRKGFRRACTAAATRLTQMKER